MVSMRKRWICMAAAVLSGCSTQQMTDINAALKGKPAQPSAASVVVSRQPTVEQLAQIKQQLTTSNGDQNILKARQEAYATIERALAAYACTPKGKAVPFVGSVAAPNSFGLNSTGGPADQTMHDTGSQCFDVTRVDAWSMPAINVLNYRAIFVSKSSAESSQRNFQLTKQPDGVWLFSKITL
jgi:hypothetical protein